MARAVRLIQVVSYVPGIRKFLLRRAAAAQLGSTISLEGRSALQAVMFADTRILRWNARELSTLPDSFQLTRARIQERGLPHVPFVVITAAHHRSAHSKEDPHERVIAAQQRLAELGGGRLITADGSGHLITFERPEIVIAAVREVLEAVESR
jgi:pimeloyl-ACP methyl ester carboxylesterase